MRVFTTKFKRLKGWGWGVGVMVAGENKKMYIAAAATIKISEDKLDFCSLGNKGLCISCL